jgi:hypothetical protein
MSSNMIYTIYAPTKKTQLSLNTYEHEDQNIW